MNFKDRLLKLPRAARIVVIALLISCCSLLAWLYTAPTIDDFGSPDHMQQYDPQQPFLQSTFVGTLRALYTQNAPLSTGPEATPGVVDTAVAGTMQSMFVNSTSTQVAEVTERAIEIRGRLDTAVASTLSSMATRAEETRQAPRPIDATRSP
jgi:hypothetical protein